MLDIFVMQQNYRSRCLVTIDNEQSVVNVFESEKCKSAAAFLVVKPSKTSVGKSGMCRMTERLRARDSSNFDDNTFSVASDVGEYLFFSGIKNIKFTTN